MTNEDLFLSEGAFYAGERLIYRQQDVGVFTPGTGLLLTPEGEAIRERLAGITDVEVKAPKAAPKKPATKSQAEAPVAPALDQDDEFYK